MDNHLKNSNGNYKVVTTIGMRKISDEEFEKELVEVDYFKLYMEG